MISLYLQAVVGAREEEILSFLSPLAPQSKLREVIRGLGSMRQLDILDIGGRAHVALQGGLLPEMVTQLSEEFLAAPPVAEAIVGEPEIAMEAEVESEAEFDMNAGMEMDSGIQIEAVPPEKQRAWRSQPLEEADMAAPSTIKKFTPKKLADRPARSGAAASGGFATRGDGEERPSRRPFSGGSRSAVGGFSRPAGAYVPRGGRIAASADGRPDADRRRTSGAGRRGPVLEQAVRDHRAMGATVTRDLRVVASRAIETSGARKRRREKATPPRDMAWGNARGAGRRPAKFQKRPRAAGHHSHRSPQDSSRGSEIPWGKAIRREGCGIEIRQLETVAIQIVGWRRSRRSSQALEEIRWRG